MTTQAPTTNTEAPKSAEPPKAPAAAPPPGLAAPALTSVVAEEPSRALSAFASESSYVASFRIARGISRSSLVPKEYQGDEGVANVVIAMEIANRTGASVFMVMQNLDVIHGRPGWRSQFLIATVNSSGKFTPLRFRWEGTPGTDDRGCRAVAKDKATGEECLGALITITLAKAEQWYQRNGSKWRTMPEQMTMYRAAAFWVRVYAPEFAIGMHTAEEVAEYIETTGDVVRPALGTANEVRSVEEKLAERAAAKEAKALAEASLASSSAPPPDPKAPPAAAQAQASTTAAASAQAPGAAPPCLICGKPTGPDAVATHGKDGEVGLRHPACSPFGAEEREPGSDDK